MNRKVITLILGVALLAGIAFWAIYGKDQENVIDQPTETEQPQSDEDIDDAAGQEGSLDDQDSNSDDPQDKNKTTAAKPGWTVYTETNDSFSYSVQYPKDWRLVESAKAYGGVEFGEQNLGGDLIWSVTPENVKARKLSTIKADIYAQAKSSSLNVQVQEEELSINGENATKITLSAPNTDYYEVYVLVESGEVTYILHAIPYLGINYSFTDFYKSFRVN